jgi:predicted glutamine amidotransferase
MCGIFAWAGRNPATFNPYKFNTLGIMNEVRGKHSCGVTIDQEIYIGVDNNKVYRDFVASSDLPVPKKFPNVIGHTRHATGGAHNIHNAHPFGFGNSKNKNDYKFIGVHNGSLVNHENLAKKRNIPITVNYTKPNDNTKYHRVKIDSEILLESIYKDENFKVLSEYSGAAALVFYKTNDPNTIYCYHGKSKMYRHDNEIVEERPLFYYQESKYSVYISSIKESLQIIAGGADKEHLIKSFDYNTVYIIKNGDVKSAEKIKISRTKRSQKSNDDYYFENETKTIKKNNSVSNYPKNNDYYDQMGYEFEMEEAYSGLGCGVARSSHINLNDDDCTHKVINIYKEDASSKIRNSGKVYYEKLRYKCKNKLITGCYIFIKNYGYYFLGNTIESSNQNLEILFNKRFFNGDFITKEQIKTLMKSDSKEKEDFIKNSFVPFKRSENDGDLLHYIFEGVRVKNYLDYLACIDSKKSGAPFDYISLSACSLYPICENKDYKTVMEQNILLDNKPANGCFVPLGSSKIYTFENGKLLRSENIIEDSSQTVIPLNDLNEALDKVEEEVKEEFSNTTDESDEVKETCDLLENKLDEIFKEPFSKFPIYIKELEKNYSQYERGKRAISILSDFVDDVHETINIDINP